jgi:hypothetical protein
MIFAAATTRSSCHLRAASCSPIGAPMHVSGESSYQLHPLKVHSQVRYRCFSSSFRGAKSSSRSLRVTRIPVGKTSAGQSRKLKREV